MVQRSQISSHWSLLHIGEGNRPAALDAAQLLAPFIPSPVLTPLLGGLLPNRDHNDDLVRCLGLLPKGTAAAQPVFSVFAADPFIKAKRIAQRLAEKGYKRAINWPTTAQYGAEFCRMLDSVNLGPRQEYINLQSLAEQGLSVSIAVCSAETTAELARLKPEMIFLAPAFELWTKGGFRVGELLRRCKALARAAQADTPIILMAARGSLSLSQARKAGASALLLA